MSDLSDHQHKFSRMVPQLLNWCFNNGYEVTILEVKRTEKQAEANAAAHTGILHSLHLLSLAVDLALFKDGQYLTAQTDYEPAGVFWESIGGSWGGRFTNVDADHFSLAYNGAK